MNFLLDQDVPEELSYLLEHIGHQVRRVREQLPSEAPDTMVLDYAFQHDLIVITSIATTFFYSRESAPTTASSS